MKVQRTITICLPKDADLRATLRAFVGVQNSISKTCFNEGQPLSAVHLQRRVYAIQKGILNAQMLCSAIRLVAGSHASATSNYHRRLKLESKRKARYESKGWSYKPSSIKKVGLCEFKKTTALFLVGKRGRDASFKAGNILSIWVTTTGKRKQISYEVPKNFRALFDCAQEIDSITVVERNGRLYGRVALTLEVPDTVTSSEAVGIDLNETNAVVAHDGQREFFVTGRATKIRNKVTLHCVGNLQKKLATHKAQKHDTRSEARAETA